MYKLRTNELLVLLSDLFEKILIYFEILLYLMFLLSVFLWWQTKLFIIINTILFQLKNILSRRVKSHFFVLDGTSIVYTYLGRPNPISFYFIRYFGSFPFASLTVLIEWRDRQLSLICCRTIHNSKIPLDRNQHNYSQIVSLLRWCNCNAKSGVAYKPKNCSA